MRTGRFVLSAYSIECMHTHRLSIAQWYCLTQSTLLIAQWSPRSLQGDTIQQSKFQMQPRLLWREKLRRISTGSLREWLQCNLWFRAHVRGTWRCQYHEFSCQFSVWLWKSSCLPAKSVQPYRVLCLAVNSEYKSLVGPTVSRQHPAAAPLCHTSHTAATALLLVVASRVLNCLISLLTACCLPDACGVQRAGVLGNINARGGNCGGS